MSRSAFYFAAMQQATGFFATFVVSERELITLHFFSFG